MHNRPLAIIFDCFGVLYRDSFLDFMAKHHDKLREPESYYYGLSDACDMGIMDPSVLYEAFAKVSGEPADTIRAHIKENVHSINQETVDIIQDLKHRYRIGLLSNIDRPFLETFLDNGQVKHLFDNIMASSDVGHLKPSREIFAAMADKIHVPFEQWLFIDDRIKNVRGASKHGIPSYHFTTATDLRTYLRHAGVLAR